jgi:hypothetical protein
MSKSKKPPRKPPEDEPEWVKESKRKWTPEAIKAFEEEETKKAAKFWEWWFNWDPTKTAEIIDLAAYRKNRNK